ncbi:MAG: hypothetical protein JXB13_15045 [Phycisphaerae bacterium]|nr:hypothetical protein [Phycisphaerae bacterium]
MIHRICLSLCVLFGTNCVDLAAARAESDLKLENAFVRRVFQETDGTWRTVRLERADGSDRLDLDSDELHVTLLDGTTLTLADCGCDGRPSLTQDGAMQTLTIRYVPRRTGPSPLRYMTIEYHLGNEPYLRKTIHLTLTPGEIVDRLDVERFRVSAPLDRGGRGEPVFIGDAWFAGLEYPGSQTSCDENHVRLAHFPGRPPRPGDDAETAVISKTAVLGVGAKGDPLELAFADYLDRIRRPSRIMLHYNSWYDFRGTEITNDAIVSTFDAFKKNVLDPYGISMTSMVPDDGYQEPKSIWVPRPALFPDGFRTLRQALEERGTRLGLWLPLNGFNLDVAWGREQGYETSDRGRFYCLVGPKYNAAIRAALERIIREGNINYFKHDFNQLQCSAEGHGHLPDERHGHEANLDAQLDLMAFERTLQPDIFLNVTSFVWHSPWWLIHADTVWMASSDYGYNKTWPQLSPREWDMSYRDVHFHNVYVRQRRLVPVSAMMTHGIIHGKYQPLGGAHETLREFADNVMMYYGRGVQLMEWYITPDMMTADRWDVLGRATRWAIQNRDVLEQSVFVGGDPAAGKPHGYAHFKGDRAILVLRNPDLAPQELSIPFDKTTRYRGRPGQSFTGRVIYPYVDPLPDRFTSGRPITVTLPGASVTAIERVPGEPSGPPHAPLAPLNGRAELSVSDNDQPVIDIEVPVPDEAMPRCDVLIVARTDNASPPAQATVTLDGDAVQPRQADGPTWRMQSVDLRAHRGQTAKLRWSPDRGASVFSAPPTSVDVWLLADRPIEAVSATDDSLPPAIAQVSRRQTRRLAEGLTLRRENPRRLPDAALADIRAAKLRIRVFDSNPEPRYRDKFIHLNGQRLAAVPANTGPLSAWQEHIIDVTGPALTALRRENELIVDNPVGDFFKIGGLALAVQLPDDSWVETVPHNTVYSSIREWAHFEGTPFDQARTPAIHLEFQP